MWNIEATLTLGTKNKLNLHIIWLYAKYEGKTTTNPAAFKGLICLQNTDG